MSEWISVEDELPKNYEVLIYVPADTFGREIILRELMVVQHGVIFGRRKATHWMPLPDPPEERDNESD